MQDHSHKLMFIAATAMWALVFYGSEAATAMIASDSGAATAAISQAGHTRPSPTQHGDSVVPNSASCPAADMLAAPPRVNDRIGNGEAGAGPAVGSQARTHELGTGSPCPQQSADAARAKTPSLPGLGAPAPEQNAGKATSVRP